MFVRRGAVSIEERTKNKITEKRRRRKKGFVLETNTPSSLFVKISEIKWISDYRKQHHFLFLFNYTDY